MSVIFFLQYLSQFATHRFLEFVGFRQELLELQAESFGRREIVVRRRGIFADARVVDDLADLDVDLIRLQFARVPLALDVIPGAVEMIRGVEAQDVEAHVARARVADDLLVLLFLRVRPLFGEVLPYLWLEGLDQVRNRERHAGRDRCRRRPGVAELQFSRTAGKLVGVHAVGLLFWKQNRQESVSRSM